MKPIPREIEASLQFSGHETFPLRQLWLRKAYDAVAAFNDRAPRTVFGAEDAIADFGVGKNMVASIRHWGLACEIINEADGGYAPGKLGRMLFGDTAVDPFLERPATAWLVHWMLAGHALRSTTWFWVFNHLNVPSFDRDQVIAGLVELARLKRGRLSESTLRRDVEVCLRCYVPRAAGETAEEAAEPLLAELGLLSSPTRNTFQFRRGPKPTLPDGIFAFALADYWRRWDAESDSSQRTLSFEAIAHDYGSPGRVFKLDENAVAERLVRLDEVTKGRFRWSESAGIRQVTRSEDAIQEDRRYRYAELAYA